MRAGAAPRAIPRRRKTPIDKATSMPTDWMTRRAMYCCTCAPLQVEPGVAEERARVAQNVRVLHEIPAVRVGVPRHDGQERRSGLVHNLLCRAHPCYQVFQSLCLLRRDDRLIHLGLVDADADGEVAIARGALGVLPVERDL